MRGESRRRASAVVMVCALLQAACGGGGGGGGVTPPIEPVATPVGVPAGDLASAVIGTGGGSVSAADGRLTVIVPAGALTSDTGISIQPITNHAHGRIGAAYRLSPEGLSFARPVQIRFPYTDADLSGADGGALGVAFQREDGLWEWAGEPVVDAAAKTVTVRATHFSDWSLVQGLQIRPPKSVVGTGETVGLQVVYCYSPDDGSGIAPLGYKCDGDDLIAPLVPSSSVGEWSVNGVRGGNSTIGTVAPSNVGATFTAPAKKPSPSTVTVSARVDRGSKGKTLSVAEVEITANADYTGTLEFETAMVSAVAAVEWNKSEDQGDVRKYLADGTLEVDYHIPGCDPQHVAMPIATRSATDTGHTLVIYTESNAAFPRSYHYTLSGTGTVTLQCGNPRRAVTVLAETYTSVAIGGCPGSAWPTFTDEALLEGTDTCAAYGLDSAAWRFVGK